MVGLPSLDGMPTEIVEDSSRGGTKAPASQRSRKGKYPVVELWKHKCEGDDSERSITDDENARNSIQNENESRTTKSTTSAKDCSAQGNSGGYATATIQGKNDQMGTLFDVDDGDEQRGKQKQQQHTALGHLTEVLGLAEEQTDAMLEVFPALAELHPDKLDVRAKLVRIQL